MNNLNELNCDVLYKNVGFGTCVLEPGLIKGVILFNASKTFTDEEREALADTLQAMAYADSVSGRAYPLHEFLQVTDNTEDVTIQTFDYGTKAFVRDGDYDFTAQFLNGGLCLLGSLRSLNGNKYALFYDDKGVIYGTVDADRLKTIPIQFYAQPWRLRTGSTAPQFLVRFIFRPEYLNESLAYIKLARLSDITNITGLQDVNIIVNSFSDGGGLANVKLVTACGAVNIGELYSTELAAAAMFVATNQDTGAVITISTVSFVSASKTFNITLDILDADYPVSGVVDLTMAAPSVLTAAGVEGYEAESVELTVSSS